MHAAVDALDVIDGLELLICGLDHRGAIHHEQRPGATVFRLELPIAGSVAR